MPIPSKKEKKKNEGAVWCDACNADQMKYIWLHGRIMLEARHLLHAKQISRATVWASASFFVRFWLLWTRLFYTQNEKDFKLEQHIQRYCMIEYKIYLKLTMKKNFEKDIFHNFRAVALVLSRTVLHV